MPIISISCHVGDNRPQFDTPPNFEEAWYTNSCHNVQRNEKWENRTGVRVYGAYLHMRVEPAHCATVLASSCSIS